MGDGPVPSLCLPLGDSGRKTLRIPSQPFLQASMSFVIRTAVPGDIAAFTEIYRESVLNGVASYEIDPP